MNRVDFPKLFDVHLRKKNHVIIPNSIPNYKKEFFRHTTEEHQMACFMAYYLQCNIDIHGKERIK